MNLLLTGESIPVDKTKGDEVIGATINKNGLLKVKATKVGQETVLSKIITLVEEAKTGRAKLEKMVDQVAKYFVPAIIAIAIRCILGMVLYWKCRINLFSSLAFVSVMIIACPCALGLATPAALMMGVGKVLRMEYCTREENILRLQIKLIQLFLIKQEP